MDWLHQIVDLFLHLDKHLNAVIENYGVWTYGILFLIIFCETGLVFTPLLPGDSLLFATGVFAGRKWLDPNLAVLLLTSAAILGDNLNYWIGRWLGPKVRWDDRNRFFKKRYFDRTHEYFER